MDISLFQENIDILKSFGGKWVDARLVMMTAAQCAAKGKRINGTDFKQLAEMVKKSASAFSPLRTIYFSVAGLIYVKGNNFDTEINRLHHNYKALKDTGFRSSIHTYIAALLMEKDIDAGRIKDIYEEMKKYHRFLTSYDDYPAAVIIAKRPERVSQLVETSEKYYQALNEKGFYKGNELQFLANMLVMNGSFSRETLKKVIDTKDAFEKNRNKIKSIHYPAVGIIALSDNTKDAISLVHELTSLKELKWYKNIAVTIASIFVSQEYADASAGLTAAVEAMIQAQQTAILASTAAIAASSSSSSAGS